MKRSLLSISLSLSLLAAGLSAAGCGSPDASEGAPDAPTAAAEKTPPPLPEDVRDVAGLAQPQTDAEAPANAAGTAGETAKVEEAGGTETSGGRVIATGELVSPVSSEVAVRLPGRVGQVFVDEGARVGKGQPLLKLETQYLALDLKRADAEVARARAAAAEAERDFRRKEELVAKDSVSRAAYDRSQSGYQTAQAGVEAAVAARDLARQRLADALLRSPITGVVAERRADAGERLGDSSVAFVIVQTSPIKLRFRLPERYLAQVREGQRVRATVDPYPGETFEGRVTLVGGVVDPSTRTVAVETELANRDGRLSPGLFARVELDLRADGGANNGGAGRG
jgi:membrane fusion protein (multidrug efflux system)